jgi:hypothetical protein
VSCVRANSPTRQLGHPAQLLVDGTCWFVFGTQRFGPIQRRDRVKDMGEIDLAMVRRSAIRDGGKLDMTDQRQQVGDPGRQVAFRPAHVVTVKHQLQVRARDLGDDAFGLIGRFQKVARRVVAVERFDQDRAVCGTVTGILQIGLVAFTFRSLNSFMRPFVRMPRGFCYLAMSDVGAGYKSH